MKFENLNLNPSLLKSIEELGYETPTEIQQKAIPILLDNVNDFVGMAQTGSGKTAAFVLPLLQKLKANKTIQAIILTPSRELAKQVNAEIHSLGKYENISSTAIYGGISYDKQLHAIKKSRPEVIVGTPGRVIDLINQNVLKLKDVQTCILDEADEMLRMGFFEDVQKIISCLNSQRRIWMFSATMPEQISRLINSEFQSPKTLKIKKEKLKADLINQKFYLVDKKKRFHALQRILQVEEDCYGIVFCKTRMETRDLADRLLENGFMAECLSGEMSQAQRENAMNKFKSRKVKLLVCTDVAARGIDISDITHVFNFGLPQDTESYVHRIGRTGRAGKKGIAITIIGPEELRTLERIAHLTQSVINHCHLPTTAEVKNKIIQQNLERMNKIVTAVTDKGGDFQVDDSFEIYSEFFKDVQKDELEKIMFTYFFNKQLRNIDEMGDLSPRNQRGQTKARQRTRSRTRDRNGGRDRNSGSGRDRSSGSGRDRKDNAKFSSKKRSSRRR